MQSPPVANERVITVPGYGPGQLAEEILSSATKLGFTTAATGSGTFRLAKTERPKWATIAAIVSGLRAAT